MIQAVKKSEGKVIGFTSLDFSQKCPSRRYRNIGLLCRGKKKKNSRGKN